MAPLVSRNLFDPVVFDGGNIEKPRSFQSNIANKIDLLHGAGADIRVSTVEALAIGELIIVGFDDATSYATMRAKLFTEGSLVVKDLNANSVSSGRSFTYANAYMNDIGINEGYARVGEFFAQWILRAPDGITDPLTIGSF